ncbi:MAG: response regulator transcription factor [Cyclobacteriaceae bacterium]|nr:response regulator transcription factor [Cyclobacteriaceae bacterium]
MKKKFSTVGIDTVSTLTSRELQVMLLICNELSPNEISKRLKISEKTFFNHRANILSKIQARTNIGLLCFAVKSGYYRIN